MRNDAVIRKSLYYAIIAGLFGVVALTPFLVSSAMFFPFITGKNFFFRIVMEIILALWVILALLDKRYRPTFSPVFYCMVALISVLILSTVFSVNPYRSFWSNYERMEGLIGHLHLFAYFLVLVSVMKTAKDWRRIFYVFAGAGALMAAYGYLQAWGVVAISQQSGPRVDGTFGNASYMAIFMVFGVFIAAYLFFKSEKRWQKILWLSLFLIEIPVVFLTATRGAILGLMGGLSLAAFLFMMLVRRREMRLLAGGVISGLIVLAAVFLLVKETDFVRHNYVLSRFRVLSFSERTVESRFTIWGMAFQGFRERPVLGWGLENFNQIFNKYYKPTLWRQEAWFDRAHNVFFDWLTSTGILGLGAYLGLWISALYVLWRPGGPWRRMFPIGAESVVLTSLLGAYFFHNLFVFDSVVSYLAFFLILGYVHFRYVQESNNAAMAEEPARADFGAALRTPKIAVGAAVTVVALIGSLYFFNAKPYVAGRELLETLRAMSQRGRETDLVLGQFDTVFAYKTFGTGEAREQLSGYANSVASSDLTMDEKIKVLTRAVQEMEKQNEEAPNDARTEIFLAGLYAAGGRWDLAIASTERALALSPKKQQFYFLQGDIYLLSGNANVAEEKIRAAYDLDRSNHIALMNLAVIAILNGHTARAEEVLTEFYGTPVVADRQLVAAYVRMGDYHRAAAIWEKFVETEPSNTQNRVSLAAVYIKLSERARAIGVLEEAARANPAFQVQAETLIQEIRSGKTFE